jgi:transposase
LQWARTLDDERVWALEDCRHVSGSLERFLIGRGDRVLRIPTHLTAKGRKSARERGKSDPIDALNVARAALQEGLASFPAAHLDGPELDLRLLVDHRERLAATASSSTARCCGICTICGPSLSCRAARCFRRSGARGSAGGWRALSRRCACGSRATSCAACAS